MATIQEIEKQNEFGFKENITTCSCCGKKLNRGNAHWAFGKWWHRFAKDCLKR